MTGMPKAVLLQPSPQQHKYQGRQAASISSQEDQAELRANSLARVCGQINSFCFKPAGVRTEGIEATGTGTAGIEAAGTGTVGIEGAGTGTAGIEVACTGAAGIEAAGTGTPGI